MKQFFVMSRNIPSFSLLLFVKISLASEIKWSDKLTSQNVDLLWSTGKASLRENSIKWFKNR